jgi:hypothetical protein
LTGLNLIFIFFNVRICPQSGLLFPNVPIAGTIEKNLSFKCVFDAAGGSNIDGLAKSPKRAYSQILHLIISISYEIAL